MDEVVYRYIGQGTEHHSGIPARDLRASEVAALSEEQRATLAASPLYAAVTPAPPRAPVRRPAAGTEGDN
jgi:hypothetical protein